MVEDTEIATKLSMEDENFVHFPLFIASSRKYKKKMEAGTKQACSMEELQNMRGNMKMVILVDIYFDYDLDVLDIENQAFTIKERTTLIFNFTDLSFQLMSKPLDESYSRLNGYVNAV